MTDHTQAPALAPCPFCGGAARIESNRDWHRLFCAHDDDCVLDADDHDLMYPAQPGYLAEIAEVWNRRSIPQGEETAKAAQATDGRDSALRAEPAGRVVASLDQLALDTANKIVAHFVEDIPDWQMKARIQETVHEAILASRPRATPAAAQGDELPPLPAGDEAGMYGGATIVYTADQMREYGASCRAGEMADARDAALRSAVLAWWESRRPLRMGEAEHIANATVNRSGDAEETLAKLAAGIAALSAQKGGK